MPAGFQMIGDNGSVLIDENFLNLQFLEKGTQTLGVRSSTLIDPSVKLSVRSKATNAWYNRDGVGYPNMFSSDRFIAFRPKNGYPIGIGYADIGSAEFVGYNTGTTPPQVDWWAFGRAPARTHGEGLEIYNAAGQVVFSSDKKPMKVVAAKSLVSTNSAGAINAASAGNYAICVGWPWPAVRPGDYEYDGQWHVAETLPLWSTATSTGFNAPLPYNTFARNAGGSTPTGVDWTGMIMTALLVDVAGL